MIQSSQPRSLKLTCSAFLLHLDLDFLPCRFPCRLLSAVLRLRRAFAGPPCSSFICEPRDLTFSFISLKRFSLFLDLVKTTRMAFSRWVRPLRSSPRCLKSASDWPRVASSSKQSCPPWAEWRPFLNTSHTSKTSHPGLRASWRSRDLESRSRPDPQDTRRRPYSPAWDAGKSSGSSLNILSSAPTSSSLSERAETSNRYFCRRNGECERSSAR
uniref:Uncharacterized protein n=1 Tax=Scleropages formosus TaxID=113540 RepID=A0A8C9V2M2_SCLFO